MKKILSLLILLCVICVFLFSANASSSKSFCVACGSTDLRDIQDGDWVSESETLHYFVTDYYTVCNDCGRKEYTGQSSTASTSHNFSLKSSTIIYKQPNGVQHRKYLKEFFECVQCKEDKITETAQGAAENHRTPNPPTSEYCNGSRHLFYANCQVCSIRYTYANKACDGVNHPNYYVNKVQPPEGVE